MTGSVHYWDVVGTQNYHHSMNHDPNPGLILAMCVQSQCPMYRQGIVLYLTSVGQLDITSDTQLLDTGIGYIGQIHIILRAVCKV